MRRWTLAVSFVLILVMSAFFVRHFRKRVAEAKQEDGSEILANAFQERKTVDLPQLEREQAVALVRAALSGISEEDVDDYFVLGPGDDPGKAIDALRRIAESEGAITKCEWEGQRFSNGRMIGEVVTHMVAEGPNKGRLAQLVFGVDGKWRIDLDSYLRKCVPEWPVILSGNSEKSLVRVFIGPDTYYNGAFSDDRNWQCFSLASVDVEGVLYAYVKRGSPQDKALVEMFESGGGFRQVTLEIKHAAGARARQFEITGVLAEGWMVGESRFDASF